MADAQRNVGRVQSKIRRGFEAHVAAVGYVNAVFRIGQDQCDCPLPDPTASVVEIDAVA